MDREDIAVADGPAAGALTAALVVSLWLAGGGFVIAVANGSAVRALVGVLATSACAVGLWRRRLVVAALRRRPWIAPLVSVATVLVMVPGGFLLSPFAAFSVSSVLIPIVASRARAVWLCLAALETSAVLLAVAERGSAVVAQPAAMGFLVGAMSGYPVVALLLLSARRLFRRYAEKPHDVLAPVYDGTATLPRALVMAVDRDRAAIDLRECLTPTERRLVEALAEGYAPKELSREWGVSLATVRTHIHNSKRKTGARTLRELAALWALTTPEVDDGAV